MTIGMYDVFNTEKEHLERYINAVDFIMVEGGVSQIKQRLNNAIHAAHVAVEKRDEVSLLGIVRYLEKVLVAYYSCEEQIKRCHEKSLMFQTDTGKDPYNPTN